MRTDVFVPTAAHAEKLKQATLRTTLECTDAIAQAGDFLVGLAEEVFEGQPHVNDQFLSLAETVRNGGTVVTDHVKYAEQHSAEFCAAMAEIRGNVRELTGGKSTQVSLKAYTPKGPKGIPGLPPHRDGDLGGGDNYKLIAMCAVLGLRRSGLWVIPKLMAHVGIDQASFRQATRENCVDRIIGHIGSRSVEVRPVEVQLQTPGNITLIDERPESGGEWNDPKHGPVSIKHSAWAEFDKEDTDPHSKYVVSLILRNNDPKAHIKR